jgi:23S rRNA (cytidine1920-2'-O)/16S rRNA (cytidine1409-2'-O)-methyltransferase
VARKLPLASVAAAALAPMSREQVTARILCGEVLVGGEKVRDPKRLVDEDAAISLVEPRRFVSRAGLKLEHVVRLWHLPVSGGVFIDAGCSTGGFTDCLLQAGARRVYAVDVGRNQLAYGLRGDPRVAALEGTNVMDLRPESFDERPRAAVADLSFRSLRGAARHLLSLVTDGWIVALAKPQFEWRGPRASFDGVVRDGGVLREVLVRLVRDLWAEGAFLARASVVPLRGRRGNVEVMLDLRESADGGPAEAELRLREAVDQVVA